MKLKFIFRTVHPDYTPIPGRRNPLIVLGKPHMSFKNDHIIYSGTYLDPDGNGAGWYNYRVKKL